VLVVDDDRQARSLIRRIMGQGCDVLEADSGQQALELLTRSRPDLILLDIRMREMDGYEVCRRIRSNPALRLTKIILVSAADSTAERLAGYEAGADDYVTKPFENEELKAKVRVFLNLKHAEEVDALKSDLITLFGHETRTPLAGIIGLTDVLMEHPEATDEVRRIASKVNESGRQLFEFVRKTGFICRLKRGVEPNLHEGSLLEALHGVLLVSRQAAQHKGIVFEVRADSDPAFAADWEMIEEILAYLLDNAVKFSLAEGEVTVRVASRDGHHLLSVADRGPGLDAQAIEGVFDEFAVRDTDHHCSGQGLSLAIARHVMELHGGEIRVESVPGEGATFTLSFPAGR